jgi:hypothetical protein
MSLKIYLPRIYSWVTPRINSDIINPEIDMTDQTTETQKPTNPLMERIRLPGESFTLPSKGVFYDETILDAKDAEVHVHPMTTIDEITMKTPDLLFSGDAVGQVFKRCIPQVVDPSKLLAKDVDFLMTALRKISYGDEMQIEYMHNCTDAKTHTYTINVAQFIQNAKRIDPTTLNNVFAVELPNGQNVNIRPIRFGDFTKIMQNINAEMDEDVTPEKVRDDVISAVADVIVDVDGVTEREFILEWLQGIPPQYTKLINEKVDKSSDWGPDFNVSVKCKDCEEEVTFRAPMNPLSFFT